MLVVVHSGLKIFLCPPLLYRIKRGDTAECGVVADAIVDLGHLGECGPYFTSKLSKPPSRVAPPYITMSCI